VVTQIATALSGKQAFEPGSDKLALITRWLQSAQGLPAATGFALVGIWQLCHSPDKAKDRETAVRDAWHAYCGLATQRLSIGWLEKLVLAKTDVPSYPIVTTPAGTVPVPAAPGTPFPCGFWALIFADPHTVPVAPGSVKYSRLFPNPAMNPSRSYDPGGIRTWHNEIARAIEAKLGDKDLLTLIGYGMDICIPPTGRLSDLLREIGAYGAATEFWVNQDRSNYFFGQVSGSLYTQQIVLALYAGMRGGRGGCDATRYDSINHSLKNPVSEATDVLLCRPNLGAPFSLRGIATDGA
jgi:hypothetical protein